MSPPPPPSYTVGQLIDAYVKDRTQREHSKSFRYNFNQPQTYFGPLLPSQLNDATFRQYRTYRTRQVVANAGARFARAAPKPVSDSTAVRELNALRGVIGWGRRNGWTGLEHVTVHVPESSPNIRPRFLSRAEAKRLLKACMEPHTALFVRISLATGARMSAVLDLTWDDVTFPVTPKGGTPNDRKDLIAVNIRDEPEVEWRDPKTGMLYFNGGHDFDLNLAGPLIFHLGQGRGNKRRGLGVVAPSNVSLYEALVAAYNRRQSEYVIEWRGNRVNKVDLTDAHRRAGIEGATQHTLKHTCCSWLVQAGQPYDRIAKLVGTSAKTIEKHYGHLSPTHLATVGDVLTLD